MTFRDEQPLGEARTVLLAQLPSGVDCPCCGQHAEEYRRTLTSVAARALIALWRVHGTRFGHLPTVGRDHLADVNGQGGYLNLSANWGLMIPESLARGADGRAGYWCITAKGVDWIHGRLAVPKYALIYNGECRGHDGPAFTVTQALANRFDLDELLGRPQPAPSGELHLFPSDPFTATSRKAA